MINFPLFSHAQIKWFNFSTEMSSFSSPHIKTNIKSNNFILVWLRLLDLRASVNMLTPETECLLTSIRHRPSSAWASRQTTSSTTNWSWLQKNTCRWVEWPVNTYWNLLYLLLYRHSWIFYVLQKWISIFRLKKIKMNTFHRILNTLLTDM